MKIDSYSFGRLVVEGRPYTSDVIIYPERVDAGWWRKEGHRLQVADLKAVLEARPDLLVVGTGYSGVMKVPDPVREHIRSLGIKLLVERTGRAVELFNDTGGRNKVIAALHLTC